VDEAVDGVVNHVDKLLTSLSYWRWELQQFDALRSRCVGIYTPPSKARRSLKGLKSLKSLLGAGGKVSHSIESFLLSDPPGEVLHEERIKPVNFEVEAVLKAADEWVLAQEALVAATQVSEETEAEREAVDIAGSRLGVAVARWRSRRRAN
jgi:hypothetical protein